MPHNIFIKGCPLCGHPAKVQAKIDPDKRKQLNPTFVRLQGEQALNKAFYCVTCTHCKVRTTFFDSSVEAITAWNQRVESDREKHSPKFLKSPWKYYPDPVKEDGSYSISTTTPKLETLQHLCDVQPDPDLDKNVADSIMRLLTASSAMFARLYKTVELLGIAIPHIDQLNELEKHNPSITKFNTGRLKTLKANIELLLAGIEGAPATFNPDTDTPQLKGYKGSLTATKPTVVTPSRTRRKPRLNPINQHQVIPSILEERNEDNATK